MYQNINCNFWEPAVCQVDKYQWCQTELEKKKQLAIKQLRKGDTFDNLKLPFLLGHMKSKPELWKWWRLGQVLKGGAGEKGGAG